MRERPTNLAETDWLMDAGSPAAEPDLDADRPLPTARGVLTPAEIEALLRPPKQQARLDMPEPELIEPRPVPQLVDTLPAATEIDAAALAKASRLSMALGKGAGLKAAVEATETATVARTDLAGLMQGKSCAVACIGPSETDIRALICLPADLTDAIIARACGARGSTGRIGDGWTLSAIDCALLEQLLAPFGAALGAEMRLQAIETDVPYVCSLLPASSVYVTEFEVQASGLRSEIALVELEQAGSETSVTDATVKQTPVTAVLTARLASLSVPLSRITALKAGSTLLLGLPADQPVELLSGDRDGPVAFEGQMGRKGNKIAIKVTKRKPVLT